MKTLEEVAAELGLYKAMADPVLWLKRQRRLGRIHAKKVGRCYMMTAADVAAALEVWENRPEPDVQPEVPHIGLTAASQRRRAS